MAQRRPCFCSCRPRVIRRGRHHNERACQESASFCSFSRPHQSLINPAGKFAFAQCVSPGDGLHAFQRSLEEGEASIDCADVVTLNRCSSPAARQAQSYALAGAESPHRVRRRKSSRLLTFKFSTAYCTSPAVTASHSHTDGADRPRSARQACDRHDDKPQNRAAGRAGR